MILSKVFIYNNLFMKKINILFDNNKISVIDVINNVLHSYGVYHTRLPKKAFQK